MSRRIHVGPGTLPEMQQAFEAAVTAAGGTLSDPADAEALVWADPGRADLFPGVVAQAGDLAWVQLPYAGIETFGEYLFTGPTWTCGKGVYATPVAEHALALMLAARRDLHKFIPATTWGERTGENVLGARITILGGGGIAEEFIRLAAPFGCDISVVRRSSDPLEGAARTVTQARAMELLPRTDLLLIAWPLTDATEQWVNRDVFAALPDHAWIINVGRGAHVHNDDLIEALEQGTIGGAALDVTEPEPLPDGHRLWGFDNVIITPHVGNTAEMGLPLIASRVGDNTRRFVTGDPLVGIVDVALGY